MNHSPYHTTGAALSDESGTLPPLPHYTKVPTGTPFNERATADTTFQIPMDPAEEVSCSFQKGCWGADMAPSTLAGTREHTSSPWIRAGSATSSHSSFMGLSQIVFSTLDDPDDAFLLNEVEPLDAAADVLPELPQAASSHASTEPTASQIWTNSQRRLETLLSRVIERDNGSGVGLSSLDPQAQDYGSYDTGAQNCRSLETQSCHHGSLTDHVPKPQSLPPGRLEGLLSKAVDSAVCSSRSHVSSSHFSARVACCPPPQTGGLSLGHPRPLECSEGHGRKRVKVEHLTGSPAFSARGPPVVSYMAPGHVAPVSMTPRPLLPSHLAAIQGSRRDAVSGSSWAPAGAADAAFPSSESARKSGSRMSGSDEEGGSVGEERTSYPASCLLEQDCGSLAGSGRRAHLGKKRVASERNRRGKIREGLHLLRKVMNGQNDYAATLIEAVDYIKSLKDQVKELQAKVKK